MMKTSDRWLRSSEMTKKGPWFLPCQQFKLCRKKDILPTHNSLFMNIERNEDFSEKFSFSYLNNAQENCNLDFFYTLKVIWVDPSKIRFAKSVDITKRGFIKGGDWDKKAKSVSNRSKLKAIKKHFEESYSWEETDIYSNLMRHVKEKGNMDDCHSMEDLKNKYENQVENLYENIKKNGYKTQVELGNTDQSKPGIGEICVSIGRNGEIIHGNRGWHRFTIARILDIDKIPVQIILRHKKWQELRNEVVNADNFDDLSHEAKNHIEHPDLQDLIPNRWIERFDIDDT